MNYPCKAASGDVWALFRTDGCKPVIAVLAQYFPHNYRVENQAGEKRMGCDCSPPQITATGNAGRTRTLGFCKSHFLGGLLPPVVQSNKGCKCK